MQDPDEIVFDKTRDFIGQGVFGSVFKGTCRGQVVAVKVPLHQEALTPTQLKEFRDEVAILRFYLTILLRFLCVLTQFVSRYFYIKKIQKNISSTCCFISWRLFVTSTYYDCNSGSGLFVRLKNLWKTYV